MSPTLLYEMTDLSSQSKITTPTFDYFFVAGGSDFRAYEALKTLASNNSEIKDVLLFEFTERNIANTTQYYSYSSLPYKFTSVKCSIKAPSECIKNFGAQGITLSPNDKVAIDISCFTKPYFFVLLKYLRDHIKLNSITVYYTEPKSYIFAGSLLKSYHSTSGPLSVMEVPGFPGEEHRTSKKILVVLLGFDGELSSFITEEVSPDKTIVINGFPGYFPKFKDISLINNEKLVTEADIKYARANNPFEIFNLLASLKCSYENSFLNIAPLGTKPMALGACLFAINNPTVRVIYPLPEKYESVTTDSCWNTWSYHIPLTL